MRSFRSIKESIETEITKQDKRPSEEVKIKGYKDNFKLKVIKEEQETNEKNVL